MRQKIVDFFLDEESHWVARLACGHRQHMRHNPPWTDRPWVTDRKSRDDFLGVELECKLCDEGAPADEGISADG